MIELDANNNASICLTREVRSISTYKSPGTALTSHPTTILRQQIFAFSTTWPMTQSLHPTLAPRIRQGGSHQGLPGGETTWSMFVGVRT